MQEEPSRWGVTPGTVALLWKDPFVLEELKANVAGAQKARERAVGDGEEGKKQTQGLVDHGKGFSFDIKRGWSCIWIRKQIRLNFHVLNSVLMFLIQLFFSFYTTADSLLYFYFNCCFHYLPKILLTVSIFCGSGQW